MPHEDDLLACLLDVAEAELNSLNRNEKASDSQKKDSNVSNSKNVKLLHDIDIFSSDNTQEEVNVSNLLSSVHERNADSSDDEVHRDLKQRKYNECGESINELLKHRSFSTSTLKGSGTDSKISPSRIWNSKQNGLLQQPIGAISEEVKGSSSVTSFDTLFGIRVINPVISSKNLEEKMTGRKVVPILNISNNLRTLSQSDDWVIAGVICAKGNTKTSAKGNQFIIWTLSDLRGDIKTVALFLFGSAYEQFWKVQTGSVIGVLNPSILDKKDGSRDEATLSVDNSQKLLILGQSKDLGTCKSTKKNGDKCTAIVNKTECEYCVYHIKKEYQRSSRRSELQANFSGKGLIALRNKVLGKNEVFYAGKSYTSIPAKQSRKLIKKDKDRLQSLSGVATTISIKKPDVKKTAVSFDVCRGQKLKDLETLRKLKGEDTTCASNFNSNHSTNIKPVEARANAAKILSKLSKKPDITKTNNKGIISSVLSKTRNEKLISKNGQNEGEIDRNPGEDSKYHLLQKSLDEIVQSDFVDLDIDYRKPGYSKNTSLMNDFNKKSEAFPSRPEKIISTERQDFQEKLQSINNCDNISVRERNDSSHVGGKIETSSSNPVFSKKLLSSTQLKLSNIGITGLNTLAPKGVHNAKLNALSYIKKNGPLEKSDPNSIKGKGIKRSLDHSNDETSKKMKKMETNSQYSDRFKKMMEIQSKHTDLVELRDNEEKEKYFKKQEVKERMEEKMANTYKVECTAVKCLDCKYTNFSAGDKCKAEKHRLVFRKAMKRFFKCGNCGNRVACLDVIPLNSCKNCGDARWERTTMMKEKNVTSTVALSIRGGEQKFVNSVVTNASINLLVPDES